MIESNVSHDYKRIRWPRMLEKIQIGERKIQKSFLDSLFIMIERSRENNKKLFK